MIFYVKIQEMGEFMRNLGVNTVEKRKSKFLEKIGCYIWAIFSSISAICISALMIINSIWIYGVIVDKYELTKVTRLSKDALMSDYKGLINYLQNPFVDKLTFDNFAMSEYGEIHFIEVKKIFLALIIITAIFVIALVTWVILRKFKKKNIEGLLKSFNSSANILIGFFAGIVALYFIDFSWAFTMFHKIFFRNDYWIFDPTIDPVINALPEELFMICGAAILFVLLIMIIVVKFMYYRRKNNKTYSKNNSIEI